MQNIGLQQYLNKPTAAVHIRNSFTATERKLVNICLHEGLKDNFSQAQYAIDVWETLGLLGCDKSKNSAWLKDELFNTLLSKPIKWNVLKKDSKLQEWTCTFLSGYVYEPEDGKLAFRFNPIAIEQFLQRRLYSRLMLQIQAPIKSGHALTLYEYLNDELQRHNDRLQNMPLAITDLRSLLDIGDDQYPAFKYFNQRAIKPAFKEINKHTDIEASYEFIREKRCITALCITATRQSNFQPSLNLNSTVLPSENLETLEDTCAQLLIAYGITQNKAAEIASTISPEQIAVNLKYTLNRHKENKVKNFPSYLIKAINEKYDSAPTTDEQCETLKTIWTSHKHNRSLKLFEALSLSQQKALRTSYLQSIEHDDSYKIARDKFRYDSGWNSRYIQNDFHNRVIIGLLKAPTDVDFEAFKQWWPQEEIRYLLAEARKQSN
ncbi:MAG: replication initiation protein [Phormidesmis sp.]